MHNLLSLFSLSYNPLRIDIINSDDRMKKLERGLWYVMPSVLGLKQVRVSCVPSQRRLSELRGQVRALNFVCKSLDVCPDRDGRSAWKVFFQVMQSCAYPLWLLARIVRFLSSISLSHPLFRAVQRSCIIKQRSWFDSSWSWCLLSNVGLV